METNKSKQKITDLLKQRGITNYRGGIQIFTDQWDNNWSVSVNYCGTGIHIPKDSIDERELYGDDLIQVCKTWTYKEKE